MSLEPCPYNLASGERERIIQDIKHYGEARRDPLDLSRAFYGWGDDLIQSWCEWNNVMIIALDGQIVIRDATQNNMSSYVSRDDCLSYLAAARLDRIRAEVEAMDWPEVIDA